MSRRTSSNSSKRLFSDFNFSVISCCDLDDKGAGAEGAEGTFRPAMSKDLSNNKITRPPGQIIFESTKNENGEGFWIQTTI